MALRSQQGVGHHAKRSHELSDSKMKETSPRSLDSGGGTERELNAGPRHDGETLPLYLSEDDLVSMVEVVKGWKCITRILATQE